jgi:hypothetical protein
MTAGQSHVAGVALVPGYKVCTTMLERPEFAEDVASFR